MFKINFISTEKLQTVIYIYIVLYLEFILNTRVNKLYIYSIYPYPYIHIYIYDIYG